MAKHGHNDTVCQRAHLFEKVEQCHLKMHGGAVKNATREYTLKNAGHFLCVTDMLFSESTADESFDPLAFNACDSYRSRLNVLSELCNRQGFKYSPPTGM